MYRVMYGAGASEEEGEVEGEGATRRKTASERPARASLVQNGALKPGVR